MTPQEKLTQQILSQNTTSQWSGEGFGSTDANARDMAKILAGIGITDIRQFGKIDKLEPVEQIGFTLNGQFVQNPRPGMFYVELREDGVVYGRRDLGPEEVKQIQPIYGVVTGADEWNQPTYAPVDSSTVTTKDGKTFAVTGQTFGNKVTGQAVPRTYDSDTTAWGGTYAGKGNTGYRVEFAPDGTPYFYTTGGSSKDKFLTSIAPMIALALPFAAPALAAGIGSALAGGASAATQTLIGNAVIQGAVAEAQGGDFLKAAALSAAGSAVGSFAGDVGVALGVTDPALAKIVGNAVITGSASAATGGDFLTGAVSGALSAGAGQVVGEAVGLDGRIASTVGTSIVKGVVAELQGRDVTDALIAGAISGALTYKEQPKPEDSGITNRVVDEAIPQGYVPPIDDFDISQIGAGADFRPDYSLTSGITFPSTDGLKVDPVTGAGATVGVSPVDYSLNVNAPFEGLQMPTSPNITGMGGGQGLTVKTPEGELSESGVTKTGTAPDLGDPDSFINKPAPDVPDEAPIDPRDTLKLARRLIGLAGTGAIVNEITSGTSRRPVNFEYGDIYRDAPIKGFAMRKGEDGRYTPFIGEKAQLAKGGLATRRK
jgi:hypothetical protein